LRQLSAVFFDRDGVLMRTPVVNGTPVASNSPDLIEFLPGAIELCVKLAELNIPTFMVTNQPDIARGKVDRLVVEEINQVVAKKCALTDVAMCSHDDDDFCDCRKPLPGMILGLAKRHSIVLENSFMVGDRWRDVDAGAAAGCQTIFIDYGYGESLKSEPSYKAASLADVRLILEKFFN
jgi:D-glycero-D-manno-heptose 1,7-bisphosphate phosphatase